jgi:hypothetical protein
MLNRVLALEDILFHCYFNATMRPPPRDRNAPTKYDDSQAKEDEAAKNTRSKTVRRRRINAFLPVPVESLPKPLQQAEQDPFPAFQHLKRTRVTAFTRNSMIRS